MADVRPSGLPPWSLSSLLPSPEQALGSEREAVSSGVEASGVAEGGNLKQEWGQHPAAGSKTNAGNTSWRANIGLMVSYPTSH